MYVAVRADLSPGLATAQAVHAAFAFSRAHPEITNAWMDLSQYLVIVSVPDENALLTLLAKAAGAEVDYTLWREPDLEHTGTALALGPCPLSKRLCANMPLLGRQMA
jgi:peptidyl-tRNA hydrolase